MRTELDKKLENLLDYIQTEAEKNPNKEDDCEKFFLESGKQFAYSDIWFRLKKIFDELLEDMLKDVADEIAKENQTKQIEWFKNTKREWNCG